MKSTVCALALSVLGVGLAFAALPPHAQRQAEFAAVLAVASQSLGVTHPIDAITLTEADRFEVKAGPCTLVVLIVDANEAKPEGWVGPRQFTAQPEEPVCQ